MPDVAYNGAVSTGVLTAWSQGVAPNVGDIYIFGGTSAGSPQWAALTSLADRRAGFDLGFINQGLYLMESNRFVYPASLHDIASGNNSFDGITGYRAGPGWDQQRDWALRRASISSTTFSSSCPRSMA